LCSFSSSFAAAGSAPSIGKKSDRWTLVALKPRYIAYLVAAWLGGIIVNL
jgi:hypothetical protein